MRGGGGQLIRSSTFYEHFCAGISEAVHLLEASFGRMLWGRFRTAPIITLFIPGTPLQTTPLQKRARSIQKQHRGCGIQDPGTRGCRWWKTADLSHSACMAHSAPPLYLLDLCDGGRPHFGHFWSSPRHWRSFACVHFSTAPWWGGGGWHDAMVYCSRLQRAAPTGRSPFAALPLAFPSIGGGAHRPLTTPSLFFPLVSCGGVGGGGG